MFVAECSDTIEMQPPLATSSLVVHRRCDGLLE